jgi:hypothetical protein
LLEERFLQELLLLEVSELLQLLLLVLPLELRMLEV